MHINQLGAGQLWTRAGLRPWQDIAALAERIREGCVGGEMDVQFLFRFRDLIAPTIDEHKRVIAESGSCWWGWWKRPSEEERRDVWDALARETVDREAALIGLFDSGGGDVYEAWVDQVVCPVRDDTNSLIVPPLPAGEDALVPQYYRKSPFSRAWMRLTAIKNPMSFFDKYSFLVVPQLPHYSPTALARLKGKVIVDASELRGMDTTIWQVRPRQSGDTTEKILFNVSALPGPTSTEPVMARASRILHVTDPHFACGANRAQHVWRLEGESPSEHPTLVEAIEHALPRPVGLVVVTGDLTFTGDRDEFEEARRALVRLFGICDIDANRLVIVPGNHDIRWTKAGAYSDTAPVDNAPDEAKEEYRRFYRDLFLHDANADLSMARRFVLPCGVALEVCAVNSSSLEAGKDFLAGMGRVQEHAISTAASSLGWKDSSTLALRVLALHHHLTLTDDLEPYGGYYKGFGIAVDAPRIQRLAANAGVQLCLHGHKHRAFIWRSSVYELPEDTRPRYWLGDLSIVGGGSAGSTDTDGKKNYFNVIDVDGGGVTLAMFRSKAAGVFQRMQTWRADFRLDGKLRKLVLDDWRLEQPVTE